MPLICYTKRIGASVYETTVLQAFSEVRNIDNKARPEFFMMNTIFGAGINAQKLRFLPRIAGYRKPVIRE